MYKIIELNENKLADFKGKIIQVINSSKQDVTIGINYLNIPITSYMWVLTCLVEVKKDESNNG